MLLLQRNLILKEKKTSPVAPQIQEAVNLRIAHCFGCHQMDISNRMFEKKKIKSNHLCLHHHKILPRISAALRKGMRRQIYYIAEAACF